MKIEFPFLVLLFFLVPMHAFADPGSLVAVGTFLLTSVGVTAFTSATAFIVGALAVGGALYGVSAALTPSQSQPAFNPGEFKANSTTAHGPEYRSVGRAKIGGNAFIRDSVDSYTYRGLMVSRGVVDYFEQFFVGRREVIVLDDGAVTTPPWVKNGINFLHIWVKQGSDTETSWTVLRNAFHYWTADHRLQGIAQVLVRFNNPLVTDALFTTLYGDGAVREQIEVIVRGERVFDPRDTAQSVNDSSTWKWSENGIINAIHMLRSFPGFVDDDFDWDEIGIQADLADTLVPTVTGTEKRSRAWGVWGAESKTRTKMMRAMLDSIGGEIIEKGDGRIYIRLIDDSQESEVSFTESYVQSNHLKSGPDSVDRPNSCRVFYYSPERNYELSELLLVGADGITPLAWSRVQSEIDAVGEQPFDVKLPFCPSAAQAQRIARRMFAFRRAEAGVATLGMPGLAAMGKRVGTIPFPGIDGAVKVHFQSIRIDDREGQAEINYLVDPLLSAYNPATDEAAPPAQIPDIQFASSVAAPDKPISAILVKLLDQSYEIRVLLNPLPSGASSYEPSIRIYDQDGKPTRYYTMTTPSSAYVYRASSNLEGGKIEVRIRALGGNDEVSSMSDSLVIDSLLYLNETPAPPTALVSEVIGAIGGGNAGEQGRVGWSYSVTLAATNLQVVAIEYQFGTDPTQKKAFRPEQDFKVEHSDPDNRPEFNVRVLTSDGTASSWATIPAYVEPAQPGV